VHDASEDQEQDGNPDDEPHQNPAWGYILRGRRGSTLAAKGAARDAPHLPFPSHHGFRATVPSAEPAAVERAASPFAGRGIPSFHSSRRVEFVDPVRRPVVRAWEV